MKIRKIILGVFLAFAVFLLITKVYFEVDSFYYKPMKHDMKGLQIKTDHKTLELDSCKVHYFVSGKGNTSTILFVHPAFSDHRVFNNQVAFFSKKYQVITIDLIGHGLSKAKDSRQKIDDTSDHINKILGQEGISSVHLVGVSVGSLVSQYFALNFPEKVLSLTAVGGYDINKNNEEIEKSQRSVQLGLITRAIFSMRAFRKKVTEITCSSDMGKSFFYESMSFYERKSFLVMEGLQNIIKDRKRINANYPTLVLVGEHDIEMAKNVSREWHEELENSEFMVINNAGHCANLDQPEEFNKILEQFIER